MLDGEIERGPVCAALATLQGIFKSGTRVSAPDDAVAMSATKKEPRKWAFMLSGWMRIVS
jgi:hypothetical protein